MKKKIAVIVATIFFSSICAGYVAYEVIAEDVTAQIEENQK